MMKTNMRSRVSLMVLRTCTRLTAPKSPMPRAMLSPTQSITAALIIPPSASDWANPLRYDTPWYVAV